MRTKVKKLTSVILAVVMMLGILTIAPLTVSAATYGNFEYTLEDDYTCTITGYNGSAANVTIPSTIYGYKVCKIGYESFEDNNNIRSVTIPKYVEIIDNGAFKGCHSLNSVTFSSGLKTIGYGAFSNTNLKKVTIPNSVTEIDDYAFSGCENLSSLTLSNKLESVGYATFEYCKSLTSINLPNSLTYVDWYPFSGCTSLKTVSIGSGLKEWHNQGDYGFVFDDCTALESITVSSSNNNYSSANGIMYDKKKTEILVYPQAKKDTTYTVPSTINTLYGVSTNNNPYLKTITIPASVTDIRDHAVGYIKDGWDYNKVSGFTIKGYKGTAAERYARNNDFNFVQLQVVPTSVALNKTTLTLDIGKTSNLRATVYPSNAANKKCTWSSSNTRVATVDSNGKVTAKQVGTATITVKTANGKTASCNVTVQAVPTSVSLNKTSLTLDVSKSYTLTKTVSPSNAVTSYTWRSSNTSVATVDGNGKVTAKASGTATITVKTSNGKTATCKVTVNLPAPQITGLANTTGGIKISWNKVDGAYGYRLYYKPASGGWKRFKDTTATSFTDSGVVPNKTETYTIRCIDKNGNTISGFNSTGWSKKYTPVAPTITRLSNSSKGVSVTWNKIAGVYGYRIYQKTSNGWKRIKDTTATSYTDSAVSANQTKTYTIRCIDKNGKTVSGFNSKGWSKKYTATTPKITKLTNTSKGVSVTWNKIAGVYGYRLYRKYDGGSWTKVKDTTSTSFTDSGAKKGKKATYTVRCIDRKGKTVSGFNSKGWSITRK